MSEIKIVTLDTHARKNNNFTGSRHIGSLARSWRYAWPEFENGAHRTLLAIGPVDFSNPVLERTISPSEGTN